MHVTISTINQGPPFFISTCMREILPMKCTFPWLCVGFLSLLCLPATPAVAQGVIPGSGTLIDYVGDTFEDPDWEFVNRGAKSSKENDERTRSPLGYSANRRWFEGPERGYPDMLKVVSTPEGGLPESEYSLLIRTLNSGVPGRNSRDVQQDDLIVDCVSRLGTAVRPSELPNCVVRIYLPPAEEWENRSGPHFGFRIGLSTTTRKTKKGLFGLGGTETTSEPYWPGMWVHFRSETDSKIDKDSAFLKVRGNRSGRDFQVRELEQFGWWTFGMSVTADGGVHYYASPGVDALTAADHLTSQYPYSFRAEQFRTFFFNACNRNDGRSWSTPFVIDDPRLYVVKSNRINAIVQRKIERKKKSSTAQRQSSSRSRSR